MTTAELEQIEAKIIKQRARKQANPAQKHSCVVEDNYLKILSHLKTHFSAQGSLSVKELLRRTNQFIKDNDFHYIARRHRIAHSNLFYHAVDKAYDVAFYNRQATKVIKGHHTYRGLRSVFYARFEEQADHVLIGNLQIDDRRPDNSWNKREVRAILLMKKNIYRAMLQESLKVAIAGKKPRILFQTGDSEQFAQRANLISPLKKIKLTAQNYPRYQKAHAELLEKFSALRPGDAALNFSYKHDAYGVIIEKSADRYKSLFSCCSPYLDDLMRAVTNYYTDDIARFYSLPHVTKSPLGGKIYTLRARMQQQFFARAPGKLLAEINKVFKIIDPNYSENATAGKAGRFTGAAGRAPA